MTQHIAGLIYGSEDQAAVSSMRESETQGGVRKDDGAIGDQWRNWEYGTDAPALVQGQWNRIKTLRDD